MFIEAGTLKTTSSAPGAWLAAGASAEPPGRPSLPRETAWREAAPTATAFAASVRILASRWTDDRTTARRERSVVPSDRYLFAVALRPVRVRLGDGRDTVLDGTMPAGMIHVTEPGQTVEAEFFSPCDFIHFQVAADYLRDRRTACGLPRDAGVHANDRSLRNLLVRDDLAAQLARTLTHERDGGDPLYAASVGQTILMRLLAWRPATPRVGALPKWRLRRVQEHLAANIAEPITLTDLAEAAGLSRMHFAAQFRVATGCRPHDYLLQQRIERAKQMLTGTDEPIVQVALSVGFQTQSHFSTVFRRLTGETPARWQRARRSASDHARTRS